MDAIRVVVKRGAVVEAVHRVHAATTWGDTWGDPSLAFLLRSSVKPLQAIPFVEGYERLGDDEIAIACASHRAEPDQLDAVRKVLARAGAEIADLENGTQEGRPDGRLGHNCSGKHAGMLAACRAHGWPLHPYRDPEHPLQRRIHELVGGEQRGTDHCGLPTFAMPLLEMARLLTRAPDRIADAMRARPELVGGSLDAVDTDLMRLGGGWIAKGGAEGLLCAAGHGIGVALKAEDGNGRALGPAAASFFERLGLSLDELSVLPVENSRKERVGEVRI